MRHLLKKGYKAKLRPSGHDISKNFAHDNGAAIPPNLISLANTESNSAYLKYCQKHNLTVHPARYPASLPEYFIRMLTDEGDIVVDPFAGSCVTGEVCERLGRRWLCIELLEEYLAGARGRFLEPPTPRKVITDPTKAMEDDKNYYKAPRPDLLWNGVPPDTLPTDGGRVRPPRVRRPKPTT